MNGLIGAITDVWTDIIDWVTGAIGDVQNIFYAVPDGGSTAELTFMGVLACLGLGISVVFLVIGVVQNFLRLRS